MKIENEIRMIEIPVDIADSESIIYPVVLCENDSLILVDTGLPSQQKKFKEAIKKEGLDLSTLKTIILTHHDLDHIGNASTFLKEMPGQIKILAHGEEKEYLSGKKKPLKIEGLELNMKQMSDEFKTFYEKIKESFVKCRVDIDEEVEDGEELPYLGGIIVIHTPGHTKGHISLYIKKYKILIAGDTITIRNGELIRGDYNMHYNSIVNRESIKKLSKYDVEKLICYHGGLFKGNANEGIKKLI